MFLNYVLNNKGSLLDCPFAPQFKQVDPVVGSAIIGGAANLLGSIFGSSNQDSANATNIQIARETNQANKEMLKSQQQFTYDMWNKQNEYNSPSNQVKLLQQGGINPSAAFGSGTTSVAGQIGSPSAAPMQGAHVDAYNPAQSFAEVGNLVSQAVNQSMQNRLNESVIRKTEAEAKQIGDLSSAQLEFLQKQAKREDWLGEIARTDLAYYQAINGQRISQAFNDTRMQQEQTKLIQEQTFGHQLQNKLYQIQVAYAPKLNDAQLAQYYSTVNQIKANIGLIRANTFLTDEQRLHEVEKRVSTIVDYNLKGLDYQLKKATKQYVIDIYKSDSEQSKFETRDYESNWWNRTIQGYIPFVSGSATAGTKRLLK